MSCHYSRVLRRGCISSVDAVLHGISNATCEQDILAMRTQTKLLKNSMLFLGERLTTCNMSDTNLKQSSLSRITMFIAVIAVLNT